MLAACAVVFLMVLQVAEYRIWRTCIPGLEGLNMSKYTIVTFAQQSSFSHGKTGLYNLVDHESRERGMKRSSNGQGQRG